MGKGIQGLEQAYHIFARYHDLACRTVGEVEHVVDDLALHLVEDAFALSRRYEHTELFFRVRRFAVELAFLDTQERQASDGKLSYDRMNRIADFLKNIRQLWYLGVDYRMVHHQKMLLVKT